MSQNYVPITKEFMGKFWKPCSDFFYAKEQILIPISMHEIEQVVHYFPILFIKDASGMYLPVALLSFLSGFNPFVASDGRWLISYVPHFFVGHPFRLGYDQNQEPALLILETHLLEEATEGALPLFNEDGTLAERVLKIFQFLIQREEGYRLGRKAAHLIAELELITPWELSLKLDEEIRKISGFFAIDFQKYFELEEESYLRLRKERADFLIYAHFFSLPKVESLIKILNFVLESQRKQSQIKEAPPPAPTEKATTLESQTTSEELENLLKELKFPS